LTALLPGQAHVFDESASQSQLGRGRDDEPRPAFGLLGCAQCGRGSAERVLDEPVGVLDVEASQVGPSGEIKVLSPGPDHHSQSGFFTSEDRLAKCSTST
jgi:hypothetical protein